MLSRLLHSFARAGKPGAALGGELDFIRAVGVSARRAQARVHRTAAALEDPIDALYATIWIEAADAIGAAVEPLGHGFLRITSGSHETTVWRQCTCLDGPVLLRLAADKPLTHVRLQAHGLGVPEHVACDVQDLAPARRLLDELGGAVVVKPAFGTDRGSGVTTGVRTDDQLLRAALRAARQGPRLIVEHQVPGEVFRVLVLDGQILDVVHRRPPAVTGDGSSTIAELVAAENESRLSAWGVRAIALLDLDLDAAMHLDAGGLSVRSVPAAGEVVTIKAVVNQNSAAENSSVAGQMSETAADDAARAARAAGLRLAGVDVIARDLNTGLREAGGVVVEVNGTPGLNLHRLVDGDSRAVAVDVLRCLLS